GARVLPEIIAQAGFPSTVGACMEIFNIVSRHNNWLAVRQTAVAGNIANANTPGFRAQDVQPFEVAVEQARLAMAATQPGHLSSGPPDAPATEARRENPWGSHTSGTMPRVRRGFLTAAP